MRQGTPPPLFSGEGSSGAAVTTGTFPSSLIGERVCPSAQAPARDAMADPGDGRSAPHQSEDSIIQSALSGDEWAFEYLYCRYRNDVFHICLKYSNGDRDQAHDLCQEAFLSAFLKLERLRDRSRFIAWIAEIAKNKSLSFIRKQQADVRLLREYMVIKPAVSDHDPPWSEAELELTAALIRSVENPELRETIRLFYIEGKRTSEIARLQKISQTAVTTRLNRFRTRFKARMTLDLLNRRTCGTARSRRYDYQPSPSAGSLQPG
ncbi:MAG TPA: sigma-70 family RNA polymerase sigma factor [Nitrospiria bacterium]|nr:sigma-70 family RNA polymerase sigma factor [Nitrospiria bacterium]